MQMLIFIWRSVFVCTRCLEWMLLRITRICCFTKFHFTFKRFVLQINSGISCTAEVKVNKGLFAGEILSSVTNSTCNCSAQNLGLKITNHRCGSFLNMFCPDAPMLLVGCEKLCYLLFSISLVIGQFSSNWPSSSSHTVSLWRFQSTVIEN